ncbi:(d)CMP kinase [Flavobacteriaceae bacterium]|jgi:CMP/dCMP kinase|nr:(d)CMP kinase [Flavobacteriaceae bacterium]
MRRITIAIDGYSSTGKSTIAKQIAKELGYVYVDSGAMYRAVTLYALRSNYIKDKRLNVDDLISDLNNIKLNFIFNKNLGYAEIHLNGVNVESDIRSMEVSENVSRVSETPEIRRQLVHEQQKMKNKSGIVMDGRDIGTVVFPEAELKLFMTASSDIRAKRRFEELIKQGHKVAYKDVLKNVEERDYIDSNRKDSPLIQANDAIVFDNSVLTLEQQFKKIMGMVKEKLRNDNTLNKTN